jgi:hypothetical protein
MNFFRSMEIDPTCKFSHLNRGPEESPSWVLCTSTFSRNQDPHRTWAARWGCTFWRPQTSLNSAEIRGFLRCDKCHSENPSCRA